MTPTPPTPPRPALSSRALGLLYLGSLALLLIGMLSTASAIREGRRQADLIRNKADMLTKLRELSREQDRIQTALASMQTLTHVAPPALAPLASTCFAQTPMEIKDQAPQPLQNGWMLFRADVILADVKLNSLADFLVAAESQQPPWRLETCVITASSRADGCGRVSLTLQAIGKAR